MKSLTLTLLFLFGCSGSPSPGVGDAPAAAASMPDGVDSGYAPEADAGRAIQKADSGVAAEPDSGAAAIDAGAVVDVGAPEQDAATDATGAVDTGGPDAAEATCPGFTKYTIQPGKCLYFEDGSYVDGPPACSPVYPMAGGAMHCEGISNGFGSSPVVWYLAGKNFVTYTTVNGLCPVEVRANCST